MRKGGLLLIAASSILASPALGQSSPEEKAVVLIRAGVTDPTNFAKQEYPAGSGFLISLQGHIITARHVLLKDDSDYWRPGRWAKVSLGHGEAPGVSADIVHCELGNIDFCLLKLRSSAPLALANITSALTPSCRHLQRGERIEAMGYPTPSEFTRVRGEITGEQGALLKYPSDVPIIPGMSGGPVLDKTGRVVAANFGALKNHPTRTYLQALIEGEGLFRRAGVLCPLDPPPPPPCDGVEVAVGNAGEQRCIRPGAGQSFRDCPQCPEMVVVPAGSFMMGLPEEHIAEEFAHREKLCAGCGWNFAEYYRSLGRHEVTIARPFAVGKFEVTFAEWDACVAAGGCTHKVDGFKDRGRRPVINVSWNDAREYTGWLSRKTGKAYRLLSEAEWEYAARAGTTTPFSTGPTITKRQANIADDSDTERFTGLTKLKGTVDVGSFPPNAFGLYDTHGNVREWVEDCWNDSYRGAPWDGSAWTTGNCNRRVLRGGSWQDNGFRTAQRDSQGPGYRDGWFTVGFRVARTL